MKTEVQPSFRTVWAQFIGLPHARRFLWTTALGTMAFNMQDIVLEPYGGEILHLSVGATSALTAMLAGGGLIGFVLAGRQLARGIDPLRLAAYGALAGLPAFSAVIFSAPLEAGWLFRAGALGIGFGGGLFAVGTLFCAMRMEGGGFVGLALGAWGAVQSTAAGLAMFLGGALRDVVAGLSAQGALGQAIGGLQRGLPRRNALAVFYLGGHWATGQAQRPACAPCFTTAGPARAVHLNPASIQSH
jgi:BCD family chlorophyll transporter-like MFS transporter